MVAWICGYVYVIGLPIAWFVLQKTWPRVEADEPYPRTAADDRRDIIRFTTAVWPLFLVMMAAAMFVELLSGNNIFRRS